jgi:hypothetical protein
MQQEDYKKLTKRLDKKGWHLDQPEISLHWTLRRSSQDLEHMQKPVEIF